MGFTPMELQVPRKSVLERLEELGGGGQTTGMEDSGNLYK